MPEWLNKDNGQNKDIINEMLSSMDFPKQVQKTDDIELLVGGSNLAVRMGEYVLRFPKSDEVFRIQKRERLISKLLQKYMPLKFKEKIPKIKIMDSDNEGVQFYKKFAYHKMIQGKIMDNNRGETVQNTCYFNLEDKHKEMLSRNIAQFFVELHSIPVDEIISINSIISLKKHNMSQDNYDLRRQLLLKYSNNIIDLDDFKTKFTDDSCFCHNDLSGSNILIDKDNIDILKGVADFGNADIANRINDFVPFYRVSRNLARKVIKHYNQLSTKQVDIKEIDYKLLIFIGHLMCLNYDQNKEQSSFALTIIKNFSEDIKVRDS